MSREELRAVADVAMRWNYRVWGFGEAIALRGLIRTGDLLGDAAPLGFVHGILRSWLGRGVGRTNEDHVGAGRELLELYRRTGDPQFLDAARKLAALNAGFPSGPNGIRYHRGDTSGWRWQIWVDCMDVDGPFLAALARETGEEHYFDQAVSELLGYARTLQADSGLLFHGFERDCGRNGELWARGNGWALMGLVDTLALLPRTHVAWPELHQRTLALCDALALTQCPSGLWHTVIDDPATYQESTLATMAAYALREGSKHGVLDATRYIEMERKARAAMHSQIAPDGTLALVSDATPVGARHVYATRPFGTFPWGQGPLLLALCQEAA
ncbi:unsaturated rhamnogalacturonyl hydrolase [Povalibacter uvarum]|uniref:Unsaturated rhamnogalacturonyl hydrolase n=1 Tax=Povalibacter uvarum TaxID=732238 RepID=A0A841HGE6_9GAMM|nr:glycoside hydrolase family 88 protein [Povalibacter uvarum]MBB6091312.1 unsaturated rhamnogalacturonyl hydrolase [Povalibacter uvarum]